MKLFLSYLRSRAKMIVIIAVVTAVFASSYLLFDMPAIVVLYPVILVTVSGLIFMAVDFVLFVNRHKKLTGDELPSPKDLIEEDYQLIITGNIVIVAVYADVMARRRKN